MDSNCLSTRYALALHRVKDAERSQDPSEQLTWAGNEMASIIRDGDSSSIEAPLAWTGLSLVHKIQHEITAAFANRKTDMMDVEERAVYSLKQVCCNSISLVEKLAAKVLDLDYVFLNVI